jgi:4-hydroxy-tetrahydrodipicolinate reductase
MGRAVVSCIAETPQLKLTGALTEPRHKLLGRDAGEIAGIGLVGVPVTDDRRQALDGAQVAIDFTLPEALEANVRACDVAGTALVIGTTGLAEPHLRAMHKAAQHIPLVYGRNMSVGVNVFVDLVKRVAQTLGTEYDAEIIEAHHRQKVDAPSGTAVALGEAVAAARGRKLQDVAVYAREGQIGPRVPGTIGFSVLRGGAIVGDHTVLFISPEEQLELTHHALDRTTFARGALRAAQWVAGRAPGFYTMADVLGLTDAR